MTVRKITAIGFMLFAIFFGAGNLIFPPNAGWLSGDNFVPAIIGFVITGVGLPLIGIIAGSFSEEGFISETRRIHPVYSVMYMLSIYLTIGPFFAIPRTATTSYAMGALPFLGEKTYAVSAWILDVLHLTSINPTSLPLFVFTLLFFALVLWLSYNPTKIVDRVGQMLTPALLLTMLVLIVLAFFRLNTPVTAIDAGYVAAPFAKGFTEGYQTMDTLASVAFCIIVIKAVQATGLTDRKQIFKYCSLAGVIAGIGLGVIYVALGWIGNHYPIEAELANTIVNNPDQSLGSYILTEVSSLTMGAFGKALLGLIVALACLTTAIGLVVAISSYFHHLMPKISYKAYAIFFTVISFIISNQGLEQIIKGAVPVLLIVYPITIALIVLVFVDRLVINLKNLGMQLPIYTITIISILSVLLPKRVEFLPYSSISMGWVIPGIAALILAIVLNQMMGTKKAT